MAEQLHQQDFEPYLNEKFAVYSHEIGWVELELVQVVGQGAENVESFSLLFRNSESKIFRHNTYQVKHAVLGEFLLFLGPVETDQSDGVYYEAVFNYILHNNKEG